MARTFRHWFRNRGEFGRRTLPRIARRKTQPRRGASLRVNMANNQKLVILRRTTKFAEGPQLQIDLGFRVPRAVSVLRVFFRHSSLATLLFLFCVPFSLAASGRV